MEFLGKVKIAYELDIGDMVTLTPWEADASEIESVRASGDKIIITTANGMSRAVSPDRIMRLYK